MGSTCGPGRPHMQQSNYTREPQLLSRSAWGPCSTIRKATEMRKPCIARKSSPCLPQLEKACAWQQRPSTPKNKVILFFLKSFALSAYVSLWTIHFQVLDKSSLMGPGRDPPSAKPLIWDTLWQLEYQVTFAFKEQNNLGREIEPYIQHILSIVVVSYSIIQVSHQ